MWFEGKEVIAEEQIMTNQYKINEVGSNKLGSGRQQKFQSMKPWSPIQEIKLMK